MAHPNALVQGVVYEGYVKYDRASGKLIMSISEDGGVETLTETTGVPSITFVHTAANMEIGGANSFSPSYDFRGNINYLTMGNAQILPLAPIVTENGKFITENGQLITT